MLFKLDDRTLFGNDAADEEDDDLFMSYAISDRPEVVDFLAHSKKIAIVCAYKGEGKSSLLKLTKIKIAELGKNYIVIDISAPNLSPTLETDDNDLWVREWKKQILNLIANEVGSRIKLAFSDDAISLVEEAQNNGFQRKSFVRTVIERLSLPHIKEVSADFKGFTDEQDKSKILKRFIEKRNNVISRLYSEKETKWSIWLIVDDIDQNFENTKRNKIKIVTFFTAIRQLAQQIPEFRVRTTIRPNIWTTLKLEYESLSHLEQYIKNMVWSLDDFYKLFASRIEGYLRRESKFNPSDYSGRSDREKREAEIQLVFHSPMQWGHKEKSPISILYTLSRNRPRWAIELAREAGESAANIGNEKIQYDDIKGKLVELGRKRIFDTVAEFKSQCPQVEDLLTAFKSQPNKYTTDKLFKTIESRILNGLNPQIIGVLGKARAKDIAQFLYQIGFLSARHDVSGGEYEHILYSQNPSLLKSNTNIDQGYTWEIHPIFRDALDLQDKWA